MTETKVEIIGEEEKSTIFIGNEEGIILYKEELRKYYQVKHGDIVFESTKSCILGFTATLRKFQQNSGKDTKISHTERHETSYKIISFYQTYLLKRHSNV